VNLFRDAQYYFKNPQGLQDKYLKNAKEACNGVFTKGYEKLEKDINPIKRFYDFCISYDLVEEDDLESKCAKYKSLVKEYNDNIEDLTPTLSLPVICVSNPKRLKRNREESTTAEEDPTAMDEDVGASEGGPMEEEEEVPPEPAFKKPKKR
jgi:hypothetical protein